MRRWRAALAAVALLSALWAAPVPAEVEDGALLPVEQAAPAENSVVAEVKEPVPVWPALIDQLAADGLDRFRLIQLFARPEVRYDPAYMGKKLRALYKTRYLPVPPAPPGPHKSIWETWLTPERRAEIAAFMKRNARTLASAERIYGTPRRVLTAILVVETKLGKYCGERPALTVLASMAATRDYSTVAPLLADLPVTGGQREWLAMRMEQKADWAYDELKALLTLAWHNRIDPATMPGSIYGAIGLCQFMPSNALRLGVDGDRNGKIDLFTTADAVHSMANYLKAAGWRKNLSHKGQIRVIMRYNHDLAYAGTVLAIAKRI